MTRSPAEVPLPGGDVTEGVVRVGDSVRRPLGPHSPLVHAVLRHLDSVGFDGAPRVRGVDEHGREILEFVGGEVASRPAPPWLAEENRAGSVARLLRRYDDAVASLGIPEHLVVPTVDPAGCPPDLVPQPRDLVGHRDVTPDNVVFRDAKAYALIDFDLVKPSSRLDEVIGLLVWWAPLMAPMDRPAVLRDVDAVRQAGVLVDAYGLTDRRDLVEVAVRQSERSWFLMRDRADRWGGGWARMWADDVGDQIRRRTQWLADHAAAVTTALEG